MIQLSTNLRKVLLADNFLTNDSIKEIVDVLAGHPGVEQVDFSRNPISHNAGKLLSDFVGSNQIVTGVDVRDTLINPALIRIIEQKAERNMELKGTPRMVPSPPAGSPPSTKAAPPTAPAAPSPKPSPPMNPTDEAVEKVYKDVSHEYIGAVFALCEKDTTAELSDLEVFLKTLCVCQYQVGSADRVCYKTTSPQMLSVVAAESCKDLKAIVRPKVQTATPTEPELPAGDEPVRATTATTTTTATVTSMDSPMSRAGLAPTDEWYSTHFSPPPHIFPFCYGTITIVIRCPKP